MSFQKKQKTIKKRAATKRRAVLDITAKLAFKHQPSLADRLASRLDAMLVEKHLTIQHQGLAPGAVGLGLGFGAMAGLEKLRLHTPGGSRSGSRSASPVRASMCSPGRVGSNGGSASGRVSPGPGSGLIVEPDEWGFGSGGPGGRPQSSQSTGGRSPPGSRGTIIQPGTPKAPVPHAPRTPKSSSREQHASPRVAVAFIPKEEPESDLQSEGRAAAAARPLVVDHNGRPVEREVLLARPPLIFAPRQETPEVVVPTEITQYWSTEPAGAYNRQKVAYNDKHIKNLTVTKANYVSHAKSFFEKKREDVTGRAGVGILKTVKLDDISQQLQKSEVAFTAAAASKATATGTPASGIQGQDLPSAGGGGDSYTEQYVNTKLKPFRQAAGRAVRAQREIDMAAAKVSANTHNAHQQLTKVQDGFRYSQVLKEESTVNGLREASFNIDKKLANRIHMNDTKLASFDDKLLKMYRNDHAAPSQGGIYRQGGSSLVGDSSFVTNSLVIGEGNLSSSVEGPSLDEGSSWMLTAVDSVETEGLQRADQGHTYQSPPKGSIVDGVNEFESLLVDISGGKPLQCYMLNNESRVLATFRRRDKWTKLLRHPSLHYVTRDLLKLYDQLIGHSVEPPEEKFEDLSYANPLSVVYKAFRLLFAMILHVECTGGTCPGGSGASGEDQVQWWDSGTGGVAPGLIMSRDEFFRLETALVGETDYSFRCYDVHDSAVGAIVNERNAQALAEQVGEADNYLDDLIVGAANDGQQAQAQAVIAQKARRDREAAAAAKRARECEPMVENATSGSVSTLTPEELEMPRSKATSTSTSTIGAGPAGTVTTVSLNNENSEKVSRATTAATDERTEAEVEEEQAAAALESLRKAASPWLAVHMSLVEVVEHIFLKHLAICTPEEFASHLESRGVYVHRNPLYLRRHPLPSAISLARDRTCSQASSSY